MIKFILSLLAIPVLAASGPTLGDGNIGVLDQFTSTTSPSTAITQRTFGKSVRITGQSTGCAQFSSIGVLSSTGSSCGTSSGGSGATTTGLVVIKHHDGTQDSVYNATTSSDVGNGTALLTAVSAANFGDLIEIASSTYDIGNGNTLNLMPKRLSLTGAGKNSTVIKAKANNQFLLRVASSTTIQSLTAQCTPTFPYSALTSFCFPLGNQDNIVTNVEIKNVHVIGQTDGFYFKNGSVTGDIARIYDSECDSNWDCLFLSSNGNVRIYDSRFTSVASTTVNGGADTDAIIIQAGYVYTNNTDLSATGASTDNNGAVTHGANGIFVNGGTITTSGGGAEDLYNDSSTVSVTGNTLYDTSKTSGTITHGDANPIIRSIRQGTDAFSLLTQSPDSSAVMQVGASEPSSVGVYNQSTGYPNINRFLGIGTFSNIGCTDCSFIVKGDPVGAFRLEGTDLPKFSFVSESSSADQGKWQMYAGSGGFNFGALNDAENSESQIWHVTRSGAAPLMQEFDANSNIILNVGSEDGGGTVKLGDPDFHYNGVYTQFDLDSSTLSFPNGGNISLPGIFYDGTAAAGSSGNCLTSTGSATAWASCGSGGLSAASKWATTTNNSAITPSAGINTGVVIGRVATTTNSLLEVNGVTTATAFTATTTTATSSFAGVITVDLGSNLAPGNTWFRVGSSTSNLIVDKFSGNVGIGTTSPWRRLSVTGSSDLGNSALAGNFTATTSIASIFPYASTTAISATTICLTTDCRTAWPVTGASTTLLSDTNTFSGTRTSFSNAVGIGTSTTLALLTLNKNNSVVSNAVLSNSHLDFANTDTVAGQSKMTFSFGGVAKEGWRGDFAGNMNYNAVGSQGHQWYSSIDNNSPIFGASASGIEIGMSGGSVSTSRLDVNGNTTIGANFIGTAAPTNGLIVGGVTGIGTSTPYAQLSVESNSTTRDIYSYGTTTKKHTEWADAKGNQYTGGDLPTLSGCGSGAVIFAGSNNNAGRLQVGSTALQTSCTLTFADGGWTSTANAPSCDANIEGGLTIFTAASTTPTTMLISSGATFTSDFVSYQCHGF